MAKVQDGTLREWQDGEIIKASDYKQEREVLRAANNDTDSKVESEKERNNSQDQRLDGLDSDISNLKAETDNLVINGDSSPQITQALAGTPYQTLKEKLDATDGQLADIPNQTYITEKAKKEEVDRLTQQLVPKRYIFGGQLEKLKYALSNPLEQFTGICFVGDSITWGLGATGNPADYNTGRDGTLSDIRDNFSSESFVNDFKRYIGSKYMFNTSPVKSNWQYSPSGEAIATYTRQNILYPYGGDFTYTTNGTVNSTLSRALTGTLTGWQLVINIDSVATGEGIISFPFTGEEFTLSIDSVNNSMDYELIVGGVSQGIFTTVPGTSGMVAGFDNRRKHTFPYVRNKTVQIKTVKNSYVGLQTLRLGGIIIDKKIRITNQGIIGTKAYYYKQRNMTGNTSGDGVAVGSKDNYIFCQLGSNDRIIETAYAKGSNEFKKNLKALVDELKTFGGVIMMVANPAANENPSSYSFNMQDARNVVFRLAQENSLDFIDNYSIFGNVSTSVYTIDGLHPNDLGYEVISRNIINSLEFN